MKLKIATSLLVLVSLCSPALSQACGYTYAKFHVKDIDGKVIRNAEFQFLKQDSNDLAFVPESLLWVDADGHYFLTEGMWGGYWDVNIRVTAKGFESVERVYDLPLTSGRSPLNFQIRLGRVGKKERSSFEIVDTIY